MLIEKRDRNFPEINNFVILKKCFLYKESSSSKNKLTIYHGNINSDKTTNFLENLENWH